MSYEPLSEKIKKFADILDEECIVILKNNLLEALEDETFLEGEMITRFIALSYPDREPLRKKLNFAIRSNEQKIGPLSVEQWIDQYRQTYNNIERTPDTFFQFVSTNPETLKLDKINQRRLMRIFRIYDFLLSAPISGLTDTVMQILRFPLYIKSASTDTSTKKIEQDHSISPQKIIKLLLSEGLHKFDKLGEQLITSQPLKLQYFPSPVRPSIKNWLADYHQIYGQGVHSEMNRASYLFNSENTKRLSNTERQRLAIVLKSLDLDLPVDIDQNAQQIVFNTQITAISNTNFRNNTPELTQTPLRSNLEKIEESDLSLSRYPIPKNKISFSSPQRLSYERTNETQEKPREIIPAITRPQISANTPVKKTFGKNVVNLKDI